ncbi:MAG: tetratricopeptide repeat protein [Cystobacterineae bacterium]|nr:tetratricopeptide repeat protein [Cystobacterineae bacterium]
MAKNELYRRASEELKAGNYEEAKRLFLKHEEESGTAAETPSLLQRADELFTKGEVVQATQLYEQILNRNPSLVGVYLGFARIALLTGQMEAAKIHAQAAVRIGPGNGMAWTLIGIVEEAEGNPDAALQYLEKGVELAPSAFFCQYNYGRVLVATKRSTMESAMGIAALLEATKLEPHNRDALFMLGNAYREAKQYEKAIRAFEAARDIDPKNVETWATLIDLLFEGKEFKAAQDIANAALSNCGDHPALLEKAMATAMMLSDSTTAMDYVERELKLVPEHEQGWLNLANLALLNKDFDKSENAACELLRRNPKSWEAWYHLGNLYDVVPKREKEAEEAYRNSIKLAPDNWKPLTNLAGMFIQMAAKEKNAEALTLLEKAIPLAPEGEWRVHYNLALAHTKLGNPDKALEIARAIQKSAPQDNPMFAEARKLESNLLEAQKKS